MITIALLVIALALFLGDAFGVRTPLDLTPLGLAVSAAAVLSYALL